ncbi:MAG TPA: protein translocase subunit SecF [Acidiferrobacteraceae bacterium]|nr:protein translocase subunit SecF [Acidiferrobacteraceae bacterium]
MQILKTTTHIDFIGRRILGLAVSMVFIIAGVVSLAIRGLEYGIDFTGGTLVEVVYEQAVDIKQARQSLAEGGFADAVVQYFGTAKDIMVRLPTRHDKKSAQISNEVMDLLRKPFGESFIESANIQVQQCVDSQNTAPHPCKVQMKRVEFVGPQVGEELTEKGGLAMLYALFGILIYVAWRFEWRFSVGAIVALVHDVVITVGLFSILGMEFSLTVLAALLAVIGYSLNDTIVVFDRIRENFPRMRKGSTVDILNASINETLPRTILTSLTTLLVLLALFFMGGDVIHGFAVALIIGVLVGTYSSIFVASPVVLILGISREDMMPVKKEAAELDRMP